MVTNEEQIRILTKKVQDAEDDRRTLHSRMQHLELLVQKLSDPHKPSAPLDSSLCVSKNIYLSNNKEVDAKFSESNRTFENVVDDKNSSGYQKLIDKTLKQADRDNSVSPLEE